MPKSSATDILDSANKDSSNSFVWKAGDTITLSGYVNRGLVKLGSKVTLYELDEKLEETGVKFNGIVYDSSGAYLVSDVVLSSPYVYIKLGLVEAEYLCDETDWVSFSQSEGEKGFIPVEVTCGKNPGSNPRDVRIVINTPENKASIVLTQSGAGAGNAPQWLELPRMNRTDRLFAPHDMNGNPYVNLATSGIRTWKSCRMSSCFFSSREKMRISPMSVFRKRLSTALPKLPVPPVISSTLSLNKLII